MAFALLMAAMTVPGGLAAETSWGTYSAFVSHRSMKGSCDPMPDPANLTYRFRTRVYPGDRELRLHDGQFDDWNGIGDKTAPPEFHTELEAQERIELAGRPAILLRMFSSHMRGSGSATNVLVLRCRARQLEVVFEAGAEGLRASWTSGGLSVTHPIWKPGDSHAGPSRLVEEVFVWRQRMDHFERVRRLERGV